MKNRRNYYRILHVQHDAPDAVIRASYRTMMQRLKMHPDLGGDHAEAALVNEAYAVLMNPDTRAQYDARLKTGNRRKESNADAGSAAEQGFASTTPFRSGSGRRCAFCDAPCRATELIEPGERCNGCDSPLYPARRQGIEAASQRAIERFAKRAAARYWTRGPKRSGRRGRMEDLSLSGMQLRSSEPLAAGEIVKIDSVVLDAIAIVVDCQDLGIRGQERWRIGLMFSTLHLHRTRGSFVSVDA